MPDAKFHPGDVVVVPFPFTDLSSSKVRPALVLSDSEFNGAGPDVVMCAITSRLVNAANSVIITAEDMEDGTLERPSRVKAAHLVTLEKNVIRRKVGRLRKETFSRVMREVEAAFTNG